MARAYLRLPATNWRHSFDMPSGSDSSPISALPASRRAARGGSARRSRPAPLIGFDMKVPIRPWLCRDLLDGVLVRVARVRARDARRRGPKLSSNWPGPYSALAVMRSTPTLGQGVEQLGTTGWTCPRWVEDVVAAEQRLPIAVEQVELVLRAGLDLVAHLLGRRRAPARSSCRGEATSGAAVDRVGASR